MIMLVPGLEERFSVKSLSDHLSSESNNNLHRNALLFVQLLSTRSPIECLGSACTNISIDVRLELFGREHLFNGVIELSPVDKPGFLPGERRANEIELFLREMDLAHVEPNSQLRFCDFARSKSVEISEEL